jgi:dTDP-4-dehydrorhamnose reductase
VSGTLLVTGGTGYLGTELLRRAAGQRLAATHLASEPQPAPDVDWLRLDVRDTAAVRAALGRLRPAAVIHTAYRQKGEGARATNVGGAAAVASAAATVGARLVHVSTDVLFDGSKRGAYTEEDLPAPITDYGRTKAEAERAVLAAHAGALVVRTSLIYGGRAPSRHERLACEAARGRADVTFFEDELRSPVVVADLAAALLELADRDERGILHVAGPDTVSRYDFAVLLAKAHGLSGERIRRGSLAASGLERPANCALDSSRARVLLTSRLRGVREFAGGRMAAGHSRT